MSSYYNFFCISPSVDKFCYPEARHDLEGLLGDENLRTNTESELCNSMKRKVWNY